MDVYNNILELIGETPIVRVNHLDTGPCELLIKLESQNPGASIKARTSARVAGLLRHMPRTAEVTTRAPGALTPLIDMQRCSAWTRTRTPSGSRDFISVSAIVEVSLSCNCSLPAAALTRRTSFDTPVIRPFFAGM